MVCLLADMFLMTRGKAVDQKAAWGQAEGLGLAERAAGVPPPRSVAQGAGLLAVPEDSKEPAEREDGAMAQASRLGGSLERSAAHRPVKCL